MKNLGRSLLLQGNQERGGEGKREREREREREGERERERERGID